jgi:hypothetical protein
VFCHSQVIDATPDKEIAVFFAPADIRSIFGKPKAVVAGDGNFKYAPVGFTQLYTLHSPVMGEFHPFTYAVTVGKDKMTYVTLFKALALGVERVFGTMEPLRGCSFLFDYEIAAIEACDYVLNQCYQLDIQVRLCINKLL